MARILVIEDDVELREVLTALLGSETHEVTGVSSGEEALEVAQHSSFDLVIADVRMEGMSGLDAIERVQENDSEMKSLVITGYASEEDSIRAVSLGVEAYLKKPFSLDDLLEAVNRALQDLDTERAAQQQRSELTASFQWALTMLSRMVEQSPEAPPLSRLAPLVESLCKKLDVVESIRSSALVSALYMGVREPLNPVFMGELPPFPRAVQRALDAIDEWFDGSGQPQGLSGDDIPLDTRIAQLAYAVVCEVPTGYGALGWLKSSQEGRFDPALLELLREPEAEREESRDSLHAQRSLLSLGKAYEEAGNLGSARQAFSQVLEHRNNRFALEAAIGLTRLAAGEKKESPKKISEHADRAIKLAEYVGAAPFGWSGLELALLLHDVGLKESADSMLDRAERAFSSLKLSVGQAAINLARFALHGAGGCDELANSFELILKSNFLERIDLLVLRLLPQTLGFGRGLEAISEKLVRDFPQHVLECLYRNTLTPAGRLLVAQVQSQYVLPHREAVIERLAMDEEAEVRQVIAELQAEESGTLSVPPLRIFSLGPMSAYRANERIQETQWRSQKAKYLLAMLAAAGDKPVSEDKILDCFWPGSLQKGRNCLYWTTSTLRNALKVEGFEMDAILRTGSGLQLNPEIPLWHDLHQFEDLAASVKRGSTSSYNIEEYLHILDLYRGPYLEGGYFDWIVSARNRLEVQASELLARFIDWTLQKQRFNNTLDYALRLLDIDPSHMEAHLAVMKAWLGLGKPQDALEHYDRAAKLLQREYDTEPSIAMMEYQQRALLSQDHRE